MRLAGPSPSRCHTDLPSPPSIRSAEPVIHRAAGETREGHEVGDLLGLAIPVDAGIQQELLRPSCTRRGGKRWTLFLIRSIMRWVEEDAVIELAGRLRGSASKDIQQHSPRTGLASPALFQRSLEMIDESHMSAGLSQIDPASLNWVEHWYQLRGRDCWLLV